MLSNQYRRFLWIISIIFLLLSSTVISTHIAGQNLPVFRVGVLDDPQGTLTRGAQLAVEEINQAGGVTGADGTVFELQLVIQAPTDLPTAIANINQASVIAVIGPKTSPMILGNRDLLGTLGVPILTPASDDSLIANDATGRIVRIGTQEALLQRALADYLIRELNTASLVTVQMDIESTVSVLGFKRAASQLGVPPTDELILQEQTTILDLASKITARMPQAVAAFGPPQLTAQLYAELRQQDYPGRFIYQQAGSSEFRANVPESLLENVLGVTTWSPTLGDETSQNFVFSYLRAFGAVPDAAAASAYDALYLLREAIHQPGALLENLQSIQEFQAVQGVLHPSLLPEGETSNNIVVIQLGRFGAPVAVGRFIGTEQIPLENPNFVKETPTPMPTATPEGTYLTITRAVQNVRTGPGLNYDILGQLPEGSTARIIGANRDFSWVVIEFRGTNGWLSRGILDVTGSPNIVPLIPAPPSPTPPPTPTAPPATPTPPLPVQPDIVVISASPNRLIIGENFNVAVTVKNAGASPAGPFAVAATFEPGSAFAAANLPGLSANTETIVTLSGVLSGATGPQSITIVADLNSQVDEGAGEANNFAYQLNYVADAPLLTTAQPTGSLTLNELQTISLDGMGDDLQWGGGGFAPLGATTLAILNNFSSFTQVHRDAVANATLENLPAGNLQAGMLIGIKTDNGQKLGVIEVLSVTPGVQITFNYRMYNN